MNTMLQLLALLFPALFPSFVVPEGKSAEGDKKPIVKIPENANELGWHEIGKKEGRRVRDLLDRGEMLASEVLLTYGRYLADQEGSTNDWLNGYVSAFPMNSQKVRKSEAKAVFDAFSIGEQKREITTGYTQDDARTPIKATRSIEDWLLLHNEVAGYDGYGGLIKLARILRGPVTSGQGAGGGTPRAVKLTDKQFGEFTDRLPAASQAQAMGLIEKANEHLMKHPHWQLVMFREMNMLANKIKVGTKTDDPNAKFYLDATGQILDTIENVLSKASSIITPTKPAAAAPAPATAPQPAAQAEQMPAQKTGTTG